MRATLIALLLVGTLSISGSTWGQSAPTDPAETAFNEMMAKPGDFDAALGYARAAKQQRDQALLNISRFLVLRAELALASGEPGLAGLIALAALPVDSNTQERPLWLPGMATLAESNAADRHRVSLMGHTGRINSATWSPDGARIVTTSVDGTAWVWDATTGRPLAVLGTPGPGRSQDSASSAAWSPDGKRILTSFQWMSQVFVWDSQTALPITTFYGGGRRLLKSAWSPNGTRLATIAENATLIWDARNGKELVSLQGRTEQVTNVDWSPDGQRMLTVSVDGAARIWDAMTGHLIAVLEGNFIKTATWSPDGEHIVTAGADFGLWDAHTGARLYSAGTLASPLEDAVWRDRKSVV